jgi:hypothetical protein
LAIIDALGRVLPVLLLFLLGAVLRRRAFLAEATVADLRRFVLAVTLPSALFLTFLRVSLELRYLPIVLIVFAACVVMLLAGPGLVRITGVRSEFSGPLMTGFEAGMLGYAIYGGVFGQANLYRFGIVDLGQVLFVFFVLATVLTRRATGVTPGAAATVLAFLRTPVILAILAGVAGNLVGLGTLLDSTPISAAAHGPRASWRLHDAADRGGHRLLDAAPAGGPVAARADGRDPAPRVGRARGPVRGIRRARRPRPGSAVRGRRHDDGDPAAALRHPAVHGLATG